MRWPLSINYKHKQLPKTIQLIAGRTGQEYNQRKNRNGAFWEDRYHATAVEADSHLFQCMVYIDLNMVRAGVIDHPSEWAFCGYNEILNPRRRYSLMDHDRMRHREPYHSQKSNNPPAFWHVIEMRFEKINPGEKETGHKQCVDMKNDHVRESSKNGIKHCNRCRINIVH